MPVGRAGAGGDVLTATYSVRKSVDSAGALFVATLEICGLFAAALTPTHVAVPSGATRATPRRAWASLDTVSSPEASRTGLPVFPAAR